MRALGDLAGIELGPTEWLEVSQERIDAFAAATDDPRWIHTDPVRAAEGHVRDDHRARLPDAVAVRPDAPRGAPPAGGMGVNYGVDRVRFLAPVPSGGRIRGRFRVASAEQTAFGERAVVEANVECEGVDKPVCVAELVTLTVR